MKPTRRDFLKMVVWPVVFSSTVQASSESSGLNPPSIRTYAMHNSAVLTEGQTLLAELSFGTEIEKLQGALPVSISPGGLEPLTEPQELFFYPSRDRKTLYTIVSAPLDTIERFYQLELQAATADGRHGEWKALYLVKQGIYRRTFLTLDGGFTSPSPEIASRMRKDFETMAEVYRRQSPRVWRGLFTRPVPGRDMNNFGVRRTVNGIKQYRHAGLDIRAVTGTPVRAMNDATVAFSGELWTPGQTVVLDHGGGIYSRYIHLSERRVRKDDIISRGDVIGLSGSSGGQKPRPHLHLDVVVNRTHVDPTHFYHTTAQLVAIEAADARPR